MKYLFISLAIAGLILVLVPVILDFTGTISPEQMKSLAFLGTVLWFSGAVPWLGSKKKDA
jgi:hypothetical protein